MLGFPKTWREKVESVSVIMLATKRHDYSLCIVYQTGDIPQLAFLHPKREALVDLEQSHAFLLVLVQVFPAKKSVLSLSFVHMHHLLITPTREVYIRSFQHHLFCKNEGLPAFAPSIAKANCYGPAKRNDVWQVRCIGDNKILLKSDFGCLTSDEDGTVKLIRNTTFPENKGLCWIIENVEGDS